MNYLKIISSLIAMSMILIACDSDFITRAPLDEVSTADYFKTPNDLRTYMNQFYDFDVVDEGGDYNSLNQVSEGSPPILLTGERVLESQGGIWYGDVRDINIFFDHYHKVAENADFEEYRQFVGEAHFFRAKIYFELLKSYGDVLWLESEVYPDSPELFENRTPRDIVADSIISDLDQAATYLTDSRTDGASRINRWMALLLQSRVALFEGTWQKYHDGTPFGITNSDPDKYFNKVVEATTEIMENGPYSIYSTGDPNSDYYDLFSSFRDYSSNDEVIFWRNYNSELTGTDVVRERNFRRKFPTGNSITKQLADSYLAVDGKPISGNSLFQGHETLSLEAENRDPRFRQTIAIPEDTWLIQNDGTTENWSSVYESLNTTADLASPAGYVLRKAYDARDQYHANNFEDTPGIIYRYAEVLLNFAEAKAELGTITQVDIDRSIKELRDRVDMPNLELVNITQDPEWNFPELSPVINEIRRERRIELATENFRWDDLRRWAAAEELIIGKRPKGFNASQLSENPYPVDEDGFLDPMQNAIPNGYNFDPGRDYLNPISLEELSLNPNLQQNPGWEQ